MRKSSRVNVVTSARRTALYISRRRSVPTRRRTRRQRAEERVCRTRRVLWRSLARSPFFGRPPFAPRAWVAGPLAVEAQRLLNVTFARPSHGFLITRPNFETAFYTVVATATMSTTKSVRRQWLAEEELELWKHWKNGMSIAEIARAIGRPIPTVFHKVEFHGGVPPRPRCRNRGSCRCKNARRFREAFAWARRFAR